MISVCLASSTAGHGKKIWRQHKALTLLYNHQYLSCLGLFFIFPKRNLENKNSFLALPGPGNHHSIFCPCEFLYGLPSKWNSTFVLLDQTNFTEYEILTCSNLTKGIFFCHKDKSYSFVCTYHGVWKYLFFSIYLLRSTEVISSLCLM